jgi:hypothetical protein
MNLMTRPLKRFVIVVMSNKEFCPILYDRFTDKVIALNLSASTWQDSHGWTRYNSRIDFSREKRTIVAEGDTIESMIEDHDNDLTEEEHAFLVREFI